MSTPAEELRAAAMKLREIGVDAASDRWDALFPDVKAIHIKPMNAWIRLASPALAEPLAELLDDVADVIAGHDPEEGCECVRSDSFHPALAVARALNGDPR